MRPWCAALIACTLLARCAQVREVGGGERDSTPPLLVSAIPGHLTTGFTGDEIILRFDERIQMERASERILFSPPLSGTPRFKLTGPKEVTIELRSPLLENTTYVVTLGEAIKDLTEGNPTADLEHVFSTGAVLDARSIEGAVINASTGAPEKEVMVLLYQSADTAAFRTGRPAYAVKSNAQGLFRFAHLPRDEFILRALRDKNSNYKYDLPNEEIAFLNTAVASTLADSSTTPVTLRLFQELPSRQLIRDSKTLPDRSLRIVLARPAQDIRIQDVARTGGRLQWMPEWNETRDTVLLWPSDTTLLDEGRYEVSTETGVVDTVRYRAPEKPEFYLGLRARLEEGDANTAISITASRPVDALDDARVQLMVDSVPAPFTAERTGPRTFRLQIPQAPGKHVHLMVLPKAFRDLHGSTNDTLRTELSPADERNTGVVRVQLKFKEGPRTPLVLMLLDGQGRVVRSTPLPVGQYAVTWARSLPGTHELRMIEDRNGNGRWDTGDLEQGVQPERVWPYPEKINVRAAWDIGLEWTVE